MMLVHHDDAVREWAYGAESKIGTFSDALMAEAKAKKWTVISMKNDWKGIFSFDEVKRDERMTKKDTTPRFQATDAKGRVISGKGQVSGLGYFKLFTDCSNRSFFDFPMARDAGDLNAPPDSTIWNARYPRDKGDNLVREGDVEGQSASCIGKFDDIAHRLRREIFFHHVALALQDQFHCVQEIYPASASVSPCEIAAGISSTKQVYPPSLAA